MPEYGELSGREWNESGLSPEAKELIAMSVHLLNNQLMIICGNLQLLLFETNPAKQVENGIKMVLEEAGKMREVIRELNDFSRSLQAGSSGNGD